MENFKIIFPTSLVLIYIKYDSFKSKKSLLESEDKKEEIFALKTHIIPDALNGILRFKFCLN